MTFASTIFGVLFVFCGLIGGVTFFLEAEQGISMSAFLHGFVGATWPVLAACALFLLQGILKELVAIREKAEAEHAGRPHVPTQICTAPEAPEQTEAPPAPAPQAHPEPVYFPVRDTPQGPRILRSAENAPASVPPSKPEEDGLTFFKTR